MKKLYRVKATVVKRTTVEHRVFAEGGSEAEQLVRQGKGERVGRPTEQVVERANYSARLDKGIEQ